VTKSNEFGDHGRQAKKLPTVGAILSSVAICAVALFSGCRSSRGPEKPVDDAAITNHVKAKLAAVFGPIEHEQVRQLDRGADQQTVTYISVSSVNGVVTLSGEVGGKRAKAKASEIARNVEQVVSVNNNLSIAPGYSDDAVGDKP
jgi:osmotically-inducible protein OsmY